MSSKYRKWWQFYARRAREAARTLGGQIRSDPRRMSIRSRSTPHDPRYPSWLFRSVKYDRILALNKKLSQFLQSKSSLRQDYCEQQEGDSALLPIPIDLDLVFSNPIIFPRSQPSVSRDQYTKSVRRLEKLDFLWFPALACILSVHLRLARTSRGRKRQSEFARILRQGLPKTLLSQVCDRNGNFAFLSKLGPRGYRRYWMHILLNALYTDLNVALRLLIRFFEGNQQALPFYAASDGVNLFCNLLLRGAPAQETMSLCCKLVMDFLISYNGRHHHGSLSRVTVGNIARYSNVDQMAEFVTQLLKANHALYPGDRLFLAVRLAQQGSVGLALNLIKTLPPEELTKPRTLAACTSILLMDFPLANVDKVKAGVLEAILSIGIQPDGRLRDAIIRNAMLAQDRETAWQTHLQAIRNGLQPTVRTYINLLQGAEHMGNLNPILYIYRTAKREQLLPYSVELGAAIIRAIYQVLKANERPKRYELMLATYLEIFDGEPLRSLGIVAQENSMVAETPMRPNVLTLQAMVVAWIRECENARELDKTYHRWLELVDGQSRLALTASEPYIPRMFMVQANKLQSYNLCYKIMADLLKERYQNFTALARSVDQRLQERLPQRKPLGKPDVKTWTTLVHSLVKQGYLDEAERVIYKMQEHGVALDGVTFEILLMAYAERQDIDKAVRTVVRKQQAGFEADEWTLRAMGRIGDREALRVALSRAEFQELANPPSPFPTGRNDESLSTKHTLGNKFQTT